MAFSVAGGTIFGYLLDRAFNTTPILMIVGLLLGCVAGAFNFVKILKFARSKSKIE